ncbi:MAG: diaminopimelate decarboxylase [Acidimicrobiales bacterium]|nr:diaminopimelate decarboxylase [Acidimicrobiales bacterium]
MIGPIPKTLLPDNASVDNDGMLLLAGVRVDSLVEKYGTPLFVYDEAHIRSRCQQAVRAFGEGVSYASKAFLCTAMARLAYEEGMHIDVATMGEAYVALEAGVPASHLVFHGNNKSETELQYAIDNQVGRIVIDSFDEIDRLENLLGDSGKEIQALIRVTPGIQASTHEYVTTGQNDSKFGFTVSTGWAEEAVERASSSSCINLLGIHAHIGSQVFSLDSFRKAAEVLANLSKHFELPELSVGGGLGVAYLEDEESLSIEEWGRTIKSVCDEAGVTARVTAEPGRAIVASAAITLYTVGTIKELEDIRTYVAVDGGMHDNPRPALYGSGYETFVPSRVLDDRTSRITLVGKHCESGDVIVSDGYVPEGLRVGDIVATPVTGAYGHSMGSNYNKVLRPAAVFVNGGSDRLVIRRETLSDLINTDMGIN